MKKSTLKIKSSMPLVKMEYAGDFVQANTWFKIGLAKIEASMLKTIGQRIYQKPANSARAARTLIMAALAHYDVLEPLLFADANYSRTEGFLMTDIYLRGVIAHQHARLGVSNKKSVRKKGHRK